jgi:hypothetical protein
MNAKKPDRFHTRDACLWNTRQQRPSEVIDDVLLVLVVVAGALHAISSWVLLICLSR